MDWGFLLGTVLGLSVSAAFIFIFIYSMGLSVRGWRPTNCPKCGLEDDPTTAHSHFRFYFEDGCLWLICPQCGTKFRPSKTLDGLEKHK